jgi:hypothetical protein
MKAIFLDEVFKILAEGQHLLFRLRKPARLLELAPILLKANLKEKLIHAEMHRANAPL